MQEFRRRSCHALTDGWTENRIHISRNAQGRRDIMAAAGRDLTFLANSKLQVGRGALWYIFLSDINIFCICTPVNEHEVTLQRPEFIQTEPKVH